MNKLLDSKWFKFGLIGGLYLLWVIWLNNYWWLIGLAIIFDIYVTEKVHWSFSGKKKNPPKRQTNKARRMGRCHYLRSYCGHFYPVVFYRSLYNPHLLDGKIDDGRRLPLR